MEKNEIQFKDWKLTKKGDSFNKRKKFTDSSKKTPKT